MSKITLINLDNLENETSAVNSLNANASTISDAFDNTLSRNGSSPNQMAASLDMNSNRIINLPAPAGDNEPARWVDIRSVPAAQVAAAASATLAGTYATQAGNYSTAVNKSGLNFNFSTTTSMADPSTGNVRLDNATIASVANIAISYSGTDLGSPSFKGFISTWAGSSSTNKGYFAIRKASAPENYAIFSINSLTDNTTWAQMGVTYISSSGSFSAADALIVFFNRTGDAGTGTVSGQANHSIPIASGATSLTRSVTMTDGQALVGQTGADPLAKTISGDATLSAAGALTVTKTNGVSFAASATTDTTVATNLTSGTLPAARLPNPASTTLGGIKSNVGASNQWVSAINTDGTVTLTQPAYSNISGSIPNDTGASGALKLTNSVAPLTPSSGTTRIYTDSTNKVLSSINDAGTVSSTVVPSIGATHQFATGVSASGVISYAQPAAGDISGLAASATTDTTNATNITSGTIPAGRLPSPSASTLGGVESYTSPASQWINQISTSGVPSSTQPAFSDISGKVANSQIVSAAAYTIKGNTTGSVTSVTDFTIGALTQKASPASTDLLILQDQAASGALKYATVSSISSAGSVSSIAGNTGAFTLSNGLTNSVNDLRLDVNYHQNYLTGLTLSTAGSSTTMTVAAGVCADSTNAVLSKLASSIAKTTSSWALGTAAGGLDTGTIANSTWYHFYVIERTDLTAVDVVFSLSASAPTMPTNYTFKRRIGSGKTDGSGNWTAFSQVGDDFLWLTAVADATALSIADTSAHLLTLTVPTGVKVSALMAILSSAGATDSRGLWTSPDENDQNPAASPFPNNVGATGASGNQTCNDIRIRTNTSAQARYRYLNNTVGQIYVNTRGWTDTRGK